MDSSDNIMVNRPYLELEQNNNNSYINSPFCNQKTVYNTHKSPYISYQNSHFFPVDFNMNSNNNYQRNVSNLNKHTIKERKSNIKNSSNNNINNRYNINNSNNSNNNFKNFYNNYIDFSTNNNINFNINQTFSQLNQVNKYNVFYPNELINMNNMCDEYMCFPNEFNVGYGQNLWHNYYNMNNFNPNFINTKTFTNTTANTEPQKQNQSPVGQNYALFSHTSENIPTKECEDFTKFIYNLPMPIGQYLCTQNGQKLIEKINAKYKKYCVTILISMIENTLIKIMQHGRGNYCIQDLIEICDDYQKHIIIEMIRNDIVYLSLTKSSIYAVKKLVIKTTNLEDQETILRAVKGNITKMGTDVNASYVLESIILNFKEESLLKLDFYNEIIDNLVTLCLSQHGTCLVKSFISYIKSYELRAKIDVVLADNCVVISENEYGNYCIQHMLEKWDNSLCLNVINSLINNVYLLSSNKYSCNVIEKALNCLKGENKEKLLGKIIALDKVIYLLKNKYAKYVVQKSLNLLSKEQKKNYIKKIIEIILASSLQINERQKIIQFMKEI